VRVGRRADGAKAEAAPRHERVKTPRNMVFELWREGRRMDG